MRMRAMSFGNTGVRGENRLQARSLSRPRGLSEARARAGASACVALDKEGSWGAGRFGCRGRRADSTSGALQISVGCSYGPVRLPTNRFELREEA